jgi:hypothetical protein
LCQCVAVSLLYLILSLTDRLSLCYADLLLLSGEFDVHKRARADERDRRRARAWPTPFVAHSSLYHSVLFISCACVFARARLTSSHRGGLHCGTVLLGNGPSDWHFDFLDCIFLCHRFTHQNRQPSMRMQVN